MYLTVVEVNQVGIPLGVSFLCQQRGIGRHGHHVAIAFHRREVEGLRQGGLDVVGTSRQMGGIFAQVYFRLRTVVTVIEVLVVDEPARGVVVVLVDNGDLQAGGKVPALLIVRPFPERSDSPDDGDFR